MNFDALGRALLGTSILALSAACGGVDGEIATTNDELAAAIPMCRAPNPPVDVDARRSLLITDQNVLGDASGPFSLRRVLSSLSRTAESRVGAVGLFRQLWDTQNPSPGLGLGPNCTDEVGNPTVVNGWPTVCRLNEGGQATTDPAADAARLDAYFPIALVNRFDLAPTDGSDCGEYRIVYSKGNCPTCGVGRNFVIFEAKLPNPNPGCGLQACRPVQDLWASLTNTADAATRRAALDRFYFGGGMGFAPVVRYQNFADGTSSPAPTGATGQIRTNQFMQGPWMLKEFKLRRRCVTNDADVDVDADAVPAVRPVCDLDFVPVSVKDNPVAMLFDGTQTDGRAMSFQATFAANNVEALAVNDVNGFSYGNLEARANDAQSPVNFANRYVQSHFNNDLPSGSAFRTSIENELATIGSGLTAQDIIARAEALSCKGCHQNSNNANLGGGVTFPSSMGFVHTSEFPEAGPDGTRFRISSGLTTTFLPAREAIMESFLNTPRCRDCVRPFGVSTAPLRSGSEARSTVPTLGGRRTH